MSPAWPVRARPSRPRTCASCGHWRSGCAHPTPEAELLDGGTVREWQDLQNITADFDSRDSNLVNPNSRCPGWRCR